jgi:hypothetical protein
MAETTLQRVYESDSERYPSNTLTDYYDIIHKLMEALALIKGVKIKGEGAHQELIDYVAQVYRLSEQRRLMVQQMRDYRNRIAYEGFIIHKNYIRLNRGKIRDVIKMLNEVMGNETPNRR